MKKGFIKISLMLSLVLATAMPAQVLAASNCIGNGAGNCLSTLFTCNKSLSEADCSVSKIFTNSNCKDFMANLNSKLCFDKECLQNSLSKVLSSKDGLNFSSENDNCKNGNCNNATCESGNCQQDTCLNGNCNEATCESGNCQQDTCLNGNCNEATCESGNCQQDTCLNGNCNEATCESGNCQQDTCLNGNCNTQAVTQKNNVAAESCKNGNCNANTNAIATKNTTKAETTATNKGITNASTSEASQILAIVNQERAAAGLNALTLDASLSKVAQAKAEDMAKNGYFSHTSPTYGSPFDMMKSFGISYKAAGENIAKGQKSAESVMNAWMNSQGHRENILNSNFEKLGVGYTTDANGNTYWVQMFIK